MKALVLRKHGSLDDLEVVTDYPMPKAVEGHVVIRVGASSFNYHDVFTVKGMPGIKVPLPVVIGLDMAGDIHEVGAGVTGWKVGDRVSAQTGQGGFAEEALADVAAANAAGAPFRIVICNFQPLTQAGLALLHKT